VGSNELVTDTITIDVVSAITSMELYKDGETEPLDLKTKGTLWLGQAEEMTLSAAVYPSTACQNVKWTSSNTKVAVVDKNGKVTAKKKGNAIITASVKGASSTCKITVKQPTLSVSKSKLVVKKNKTVSINAKATPTKTITYKSNNKKIATVTKDGKVKGLRSGTTEIFVSCNGVTKKIMITVVK